MVVRLSDDRSEAARHEAMDRILANHLLYCTVCDNNNGNCIVHNTTEKMGIEHQKYPFTPKTDASGVDYSQPVLPVRPEPVHRMREMRGSLPKSAGERNAFH
jgi:formate dehydrogenase major subunit